MADHHFDDETATEKKESERSPGGVQWIKKRIQLPQGGVGKPSVIPSEVATNWLFYDFAVGQSKLKRKHQEEGPKVAEAILDSLAYFSPSERVPIEFVGYASKSGPESLNKSLARCRAGEIQLLLQRCGVPPMWLKKELTICDVVQIGDQRTPQGRSASRSAQVILPTAYLRPQPIPFSQPLRIRVKEKLKTYRPGVGTVAEWFFPFCQWVLDNWDYLVQAKYCWYSHGDVMKVQSKGLFFQMPTQLTPWPVLMNPEQAFTYLERLHEDFQASKQRYNRNYAPPGSFTGTLYLDIAYTQSLRWWCLDHFTTGFEKAHTTIDRAKLNAIAIQKLIKQGKFGKTPSEMFKGINEYLEKHGIPCRVSPDNEHPRWI